MRVAGDGRSATVLLFTGVQYERPRDEPEPERQPRRRKAVRV